MDRAPQTRVLIAVVPDNQERLTRVLAGHELTFVDTCDEAMAILTKETYGMVIVSVHFDESQMFRLLRDIRAHAHYRKVPILCVLGSALRVLSEVAVEGLDHAVKAMTANGFLNLAKFLDDDRGNARLRRIVDYLILIDGDLQQTPIADQKDPERLAEGPKYDWRRRSERRQS